MDLEAPISSGNGGGIAKLSLRFGDTPVAKIWILAKVL